MTKPKSEYAIQTVQNALRLLEAFHDDVELGVSELARRMQLHKNNVFRLLATLEGSGYIEQSDSTDRYRLGARCLELGRSFVRSSPLRERARPVLEALATGLGEAAHLGVLHGFDVVHLDGHRDGGQLVAAAMRIGQRLPAHCTALGKVLVGHAGEDAWRDYDAAVVSRGLPGASTQTITDRDKLFEHLRGVVAAGFALDIDECECGLRCAAAPVFDGEQRVVAALSVSAPSPRLHEERLHDEVVPALRSACERLSEQLGCLG